MGSNSDRQNSSSSQGESNSQETNKSSEKADSQTDNGGYGNQDTWNDSQTEQQPAAN